MTARIPVYSHEVYDIVLIKNKLSPAPDFLIIEGINVFQNQKQSYLYDWLL